MSVRAYRRVTQPTLAEEASFSLSHNWELVDALLALDSSYDGLNDGGGGEIEVNAGELREFLKTDKDLDEGTRRMLEADLATTVNDDDVISYECF